METTLDGLLDKRVTLEQPAHGYRVAIDTVLLAAAVPARAGQRVLDLGCGAGGAMLCLARRVPHILVTGIDIRHEMVLLCRDNIVRNKPEADLKAHDADATKLSPAMAARFDHAMMNPPYQDEERHDLSPHLQKRMANAAPGGDLALWIENAAKVLKPGGVLTLIHRADRLDEILAALRLDFGAVGILPVAPKENKPPKRIVLRARKGADRCVNHSRTFVLHQADGRYTDAADSVLRHMQALQFGV
jgi:tRNA1(Val) A37 N6-methylase TrmN6